MKFKVGDKVRVLDGSKITDYIGGWAKGMKVEIGTIYEVRNIGRYGAVYLKNSPYSWDERGLELIESKVEEDVKERTITISSHDLCKAIADTAHEDETIEKNVLLREICFKFGAKLVSHLFDREA